LLPVSDDNFRSRRKKSSIIFVTRASKVGPRLGINAPFIPKPSYAESGGKFCEVENPKSSINLGFTNPLSINFTLFPGDLFTSRLKVGSSNTIDLH
jgi:hypothetical protein